MLELNADTEIRSYECPSCYLCGASGILLYEKLSDRIFNASGTWNLTQCPNSECGLVWLNPMPLASDIGKAYKTYYTHDTSVKKSIVWHLIRAPYRFMRFASSYLLGVRKEEVQRENMYLSQKPGRLLDIGCGSGKYLNRMKQAGWEVEGIDFDPMAAKAVESKYGIKVHTGTLDSVEYPDHSFDAITINHAIEHVPDPITLLRECYRILKPGGYLVAATPNMNSWGHEKFASSWLHLDPPRHLFLFSPRSLKACAQKAGFNQIDIRTTSVRSANDLGGSIDIQQSGHHSMMRPNKINRLMGLLTQNYCLLFNKKHNSGEEVILMVQKNS